MNNLRFLVVDDDEFTRKVLVAHLRRLGAGGVVTAENGELAATALETQGPFQVVLSDLMMPEMDGVQFLDRLAGHHPRPALILMSSAGAKVLSTVESLARGRKLKVLGSIGKPVTVATLDTLLQQLFAPAPAVRPPPPAQSPVTVDDLDLAEAIRAEQIGVHVQPQVEFRSGKLVSVEALARWSHPALGAISPERFIPLAESSGLIVPLTELVCRKALTACGAWNRAGLRISIGLNYSFATLDNPDLPDQIARLAASHGVAPEQVVIELTESSVARDADRALGILTRMRLRDMALSIDDFGTGYSSLQQLKQIPFSELKIDQSFVSSVTYDAESRSIVESNIRLARDLGLRTVAEGVETAEDYALLKALGCDIAQGYYIARPMPPDELLAWVQKPRHWLR